MKITLCFQGEEVYELELPDNTKAIKFDLSGDEVEVYKDTFIKIPKIEVIEFFEK